MSDFDPDHVDWDAYMAAVYTPPPALKALPDYEIFWRTIGGQGFGFPEIEDRARRARVGIPTSECLNAGAEAEKSSAK